VLFADYADKLNPYGKAQRRGIVVTNNSIYKHDPRSYAVKKFGTPISRIASISMSPNSGLFRVVLLTMVTIFNIFDLDTFVVVHGKDGLRDLVLNLGVNRCERVSEFVTVVATQYQNLTNQKLTINFVERYLRFLFSCSRVSLTPLKKTLGFLTTTREPRPRLERTVLSRLRRHQTLSTPSVPLSKERTTTTSFSTPSRNSTTTMRRRINTVLPTLTTNTSFLLLDFLLPNNSYLCN